MEEKYENADHSDEDRLMALFQKKCSEFMELFEVLPEKDKAELLFRLIGAYPKKHLFEYEELPSSLSDLTGQESFGIESVR